MTNTKTSNTNLKMLRAKFGFRQKDLSELLHLSTVQYAKKENSKATFSLTEAKTIADFFKLPIEDIFFNTNVKFLSK